LRVKKGERKFERTLPARNPEGGKKKKSEKGGEEKSVGESLT